MSVVRRWTEIRRRTRSCDGRRRVGTMPIKEPASHDVRVAAERREKMAVPPRGPRYLLHTSAVDRKSRVFRKRKTARTAIAGSQPLPPRLRAFATSKRDQAVFAVSPSAAWPANAEGNRTLREASGEPSPGFELKLRTAEADEADPPGRQCQVRREAGRWSADDVAGAQGRTRRRTNLPDDGQRVLGRSGDDSRRRPAESVGAAKPYGRTEASEHPAAAKRQALGIEGQSGLPPGIEREPLRRKADRRGFSCCDEDR